MNVLWKWSIDYSRMGEGENSQFRSEEYEQRTNSIEKWIHAC